MYLLAELLLFIFPQIVGIDSAKYSQPPV